MEREAVAPVTKQVHVSLPREEAFALFTKGMGSWWPLATHSIAADTHEGRVTAERLVFETREGGRIYEVMSDGSEGEWGTVLLWAPPESVVFSWKPNLTEGPSTEVEVRFTDLGEETAVELVHRGWERFGTDARERRSGYDTGWPSVLELYRSVSEAA